VAVALPESIDEAVALLAAEPTAHLLAGGTDFMVEVNFGQRRPPAVVALHRVADLKGWRRAGRRLVLGGGCTWTELLDPRVAAMVPALAQASRTVGSPQIRNAGTIAGNLATASPAGDGLPPLYALDALVTLAGPGGRRTVPVTDFIVGPKRTVLEPGELIAAVDVPVLRGRQAYLKVGARNAMVIAVASVALVVDHDGAGVRCALGSVGPTVIRAGEAEEWLSQQIDLTATAGPPALSPGVAAEFGRRVADEARPVDDHRSTADYRRHAVGVLAARALERCLG
jgi:CO/xanthine dehydrogenase FAD-binding subunit